MRLHGLLGKMSVEPDGEGFASGGVEGHTDDGQERRVETWVASRPLRAEVQAGIKPGPLVTLGSE